MTMFTVVYIQYRIMCRNKHNVWKLVKIILPTNLSIVTVQMIIRKCTIITMG